MGNMTAEVMDVKGAFLKGDTEDREDIHMKIPHGWGHHYNDDEVLKLKPCLYNLKQAAMTYGNKKKHSRSLSLLRCIRLSDITDR